jgi:hypothetical protein
VFFSENVPNNFYKEDVGQEIPKTKRKEEKERRLTSGAFYPAKV